MRNSLEMVANAIVGGQMGVILKTETEPTWASVRASLNPYLNRVKKLTTYSNVGFGCQYGNVVKSHAEKCGVDTKANPFVVSERKGMHPKYEGNPRIFVGNSNPEQHYLVVVFRGNETKKTEWLLDGKLVTDQDVIADIKAHIRQSKPSAKQLAYGISNEEIVNTISVKFENVVLLKQGDKVYNRQIEETTYVVVAATAKR